MNMVYMGMELMSAFCSEINSISFKNCYAGGNYGPLYKAIKDPVSGHRSASKSVR